MLSLRKRLGLDRPYFLVVGRVELRKNIAGVLKAFGLLQASDLPPHLLVLRARAMPTPTTLTTCCRPRAATATCW